MKRILRSSLVPLAAIPWILVSSCQESPRMNIEGTRFLKGEIQGGNADATDTGVVALAIDVGGGNQAACTGSLIAPNLVLTARHCVAQVANQIYCGSTTFGSQYGAAAIGVITDQNPNQYSFWYGVHEVRVLPSNLVCGNDIALLILSQNVVDSSVKLITPQINSSPYGSQGYSAVGYGNTCGTCTDAMTGRFRRNGLQVGCVGSSCGDTSVIADGEWLGGDAVCSGDSGGPALDSNGQVLGVAARGGVTGNTCIESIYEELNTHQAWIIQAALDAATYGSYAPPTWAGGSDAGFDAPPATCDQCSQQAIVPGAPCASAWQACVTSTDCNDWITCVNGCAANDNTCITNCDTQHATGYNLYKAVWDCTCTSGCVTECATQCAPPPCGGWSVSQTQACQDCFTTNCCSQGAACTGPCYDLIVCLNGCAANDQTCVNNCASAHQAGVTPYNDFSKCLGDNCSTPCGWNTGGSGGAAGAGGSGGIGPGGSGGIGPGGSGGVGPDGSGGVGPDGSGGIGPGGSGGTSAGGTGGTSTAGSGGTHAGGSGGAVGGSGGTHAGGSGGTVVDDGGSAPPLGAGNNDSGSCGCRTAGGPDGSPLAAFGLLSALAVVRLRRRRAN